MISAILWFFQTDLMTAYELALKLAGGGIGAGSVLFGLSKAINSATKFVHSIRDGRNNGSGEIRVSFSDDFMDRFVIKMNEAQRPIIESLNSTIKAVNSTRRALTKHSKRIEEKVDLAVLRQKKILNNLH
jgi:hypothetical protein